MKHCERDSAHPLDQFSSEDQKRPVVKYVDGHWENQSWALHIRMAPATGATWRLVRTPL